MSPVGVDVCENSQSLLVSFSNGQIKSDGANNVQFKLFENAKTPDGLTRKRPRRILIGDVENLQYIGCNFGENAPKLGNQCSFFIGVHDKKAKKMKLYKSQLFNLEPNIEIPDINDDELPAVERSYAEKLDALTIAFGSKLKRGQMESRLQQSIDNSDLIAIASKAVEEAKAAPSVETPQAEETAESDVIPPQNKNAVEAKDVYNLEDIISNEEYNAIEPEAKCLIDATKDDLEQWKKDKIHSVYVLEHIKKLPRGSLRDHHGRLLAYFQFLIQVTQLQYREVKKKDPLPAVPEPFKEKFLKKYTIENINRSGKVERSMPSKMKDKAAAHALLLALFLDNMEVNLNLIQPAFKLPLNRLCLIAGALGCHVLTRKNSETGLINKIAQLSLPLYVPLRKPLKKGRR